MKPQELFELLHYHPHAGQQAFHDSDARFKVLIAGARFGKSLAAARDVLREILSGKTRGWLVGPTYDLTRPEFRYIRDDLYRLGERPLERSNPPSLTTSWGAEVICLSAHSPQALLGDEIDWLILCEAAHIERDAFERFLRARLATRSGRMIVPTTPHGYNWIFDLYRRGLGHEGEWQSFRHATWENPNIPPGEILAARRDLPADTFDEQYGGAFTSPSGRVYREYERGLHVVNGLEPPPGAIIFKAIDFGYTNPFACLWGAQDSDGRLLILREHYCTGLALSRQAEAMRVIDAGFEKAGCEIGPAFADPSGALERRLLQEEGLPTHAADNRVSGGIEIVRRRMLLREDGRPGLLIDSGCTNLLREIEGYQWDESSLERRMPRKADDHALDALRYLCVALARKVDWKNAGTLW
ncbi:MAG: terminase family protein [Planctomycetes bacterium]|nr:terminase family protein [Planctomycetota bacterium]